MIPGFHTVIDLGAAGDLVRRCRYGVIDVVNERLAEVRFRPFPALVSIWEARWLGNWRHQWRTGNRCCLYFNQPRSCPGYLALIYLESTRQTSLATVLGGLDILDTISRIKGSEAIVCEISNERISDRMLRRRGWQRHCLNLRGRHYIKRRRAHD